MSSELERVLDAQGNADPAKDPKADPALLVRLYEHMLLLRALDTRMMNLQRQGRIGFFGTTTGEEAATLGSAAAVRDSDWVFPALRQGSVLLWRGFPLKAFIAQLIGNTGDVLNGHQMPCHYADRGVNVVAWSSVIGTQLPHAVGMAWAARHRGSDDIAVAYLGDGATSSADFHAAMNFAGVWQAPVVFVCQNNHWAISVPVSRQTAVSELVRKADGYGVPGVRVDGNDALAVYGAVRAAAERARRGGGPTFIECVTYRIGGHSSSDDPTRYREDAQVAEWRAKDPVARFRAHLVGRGLWDDAKEEAANARWNDAIGVAIREAEAMPAPAVESIFDGVYATLPWNLREQRDWLTSEGGGHAAGEGRFPL
jgi:pyruvate dehydrogenase E1 component alpha subunit/2-oxoisovalerate dehydrogenase E1 component alpha subunit